MNKQEKQDIIKAPCIGYFSGFGGIEIKHIQHIGLDDYVVYVAGAWCSKQSVHRTRVYYTPTTPYFKYNGVRIHLDECISTNL